MAFLTTPNFGEARASMVPPVLISFQSDLMTALLS